MAMTEERCAACGCLPEGKNCFTYCSYRRVFICLQCERACENYSAEMLRNGTHCKKKFFEEETKYRLLSYRILAPEYDVQGAISKYEKMNSVELYEKFRQEICLYNNIPKDETDRRAQYRVELAAMQQVLKYRELANPKLSSWARRFFNEVGDNN